MSSFPDFASQAPIAILNESRSFGEMSLIQNQPRNATIISLTSDTRLMRIDRVVYLELLRQEQALQLRLLVAFLRRVSLFAQWTEQQIEKRLLLLQRGAIQAWRTH